MHIFFVSSLSINTEFHFILSFRTLRLLRLLRAFRDLPLFIHSKEYPREGVWEKPSLTEPEMSG
jgi:hypothetical protein